MTNVQTWVPLAMTALEQTGIVDTTSLSAQSTHQAQLASFGAAIVQSGLLPAVVFLENEQAKTDRKLLGKAILHLLQATQPQDEQLSKATSLTRYLLDSKASMSQKSEHIQQAVIALKLAIRTYQLIKE